MNFYDHSNRRGKRWGGVIVVLYLVVCALVMFLTYTIAVPEPDEAIMVVEIVPDDEIPVPVRASASPEPDEAAPVAEAPNVAEPVSDRDRAVSNPPTQTAAVSLDPAAPELPVTREDTDSEELNQQTPRVNERALFPGSAAGATGGEDGAAVRTSSPTVGSASNSQGFSLDGRYLIGRLPLPSYDVDVEGRVVVRITVNADGRVTNASYEQAGSTTSHGTLVAAALAAARRARFTAAEADIQTGTVTYFFRIKANE